MQLRHALQGDEEPPPVEEVRGWVEDEKTREAMPIANARHITDLRVERATVASDVTNVRLGASDEVQAETAKGDALAETDKGDARAEAREEDGNRKAEKEAEEEGGEEPEPHYDVSGVMKAPVQEMDGVIEGVAQACQKAKKEDADDEPMDGVIGGVAQACQKAKKEDDDDPMDDALNVDDGITMKREADPLND